VCQCLGVALSQGRRVPTSQGLRVTVCQCLNSRVSHACRGKGLKHLLGATKRVFSLFYIFCNSDYRQRFPLNLNVVWRYRKQRFGVLKFLLSPLHSTRGGSQYVSISTVSVSQYASVSYWDTETLTYYVSASVCQCVNVSVSVCQCQCHSVSLCQCQCLGVSVCQCLCLTSACHTTYAGWLQCAAVCCSVLQCVEISKCSTYYVCWLTAACCSVLHCVAVCCSVLHCALLCCSQSLSLLWHNPHAVFLAWTAARCSVLPCIAACVIVLQSDSLSSMSYAHRWYL